MPDRNKVMRGLQQCIDGECGPSCPYSKECGEPGAPRVMGDALDLLADPPVALTIWCSLDASDVAVNTGMRISGRGLIRQKELTRKMRTVGEWLRFPNRRRRKTMPDREKVIGGLESHANSKTCKTCAGHDCPYYHLGGSYPKVTCSSILAADALVLLKEQEARVMTYEEIKENLGVPVWVEYADDENSNGYGVPTYDHEAYIMIFGANDYCRHNARSHNVKWRCWTYRPTDEQRKEVPWDEPTEI